MADSPKTQLTLFSKYWQPGNVKTRLAAEMGDERAADLYRSFVATSLARFKNIAQRSVICYTPWDTAVQFAEFSQPPWEIEPQRGGDLGHRMHAHMKRALELGRRRVVVVGADVPDVPVNWIARAFELLDRSQVVLGPTGDGGYYLVGVRDNVPDIFRNIDWGTASVWQQTVDRLRANGLQYKNGYDCVPAHNDVDTIEDLRRLRDELRENASHEFVLADLFDVVERTLLDVAS